MTVEIYSNNSEQQKMVGNPVQFVADDSSPVDNFTASVDPSLNGVSSVQVTNNGRVTTAPLGRTLYAGTANITDGLITATYDGQLYNPSAIPADLNSIILANTEEKIASGSVSSFNCQLGEYPVKDLTVGIEPVQDLHGQANPYPPGGGKNLLPLKDETYTGNGVTITPIYDNSGNQIGYDLNGTASSNIDWWFLPAEEWSWLASGTYRYFTTGLSTAVTGFSLVFSPDYFSVATNKIMASQVKGCYIHIDSGIVLSHLKIYPMICLDSESDKSFAPYSNICPISGWTGCNISHSGADTSDPTVIPISWQSSAGTVYGGTLDVTTGVLTVDRASVTPNSSITVYGPNSGWTNRKAYGWALDNAKMPSSPQVAPDFLECSHGSKVSIDNIIWSTDTTFRVALNGGSIYMPIDSASTVPEAKQWMIDNNIQIVYELATPQTYQLDPVTVQTLLGQNNIWSDTGSSTVEYRDGRINETSVLTQSNALISGEQVTYPLALPIILSGNRTPIYTYPGENNMSANVNSFSVTWSKHWFDITPWIAWQGLTFSLNSIDAPNAGRDMAGYMHRGMVAIKEKMNVNTVPLTRSQSAKLYSLLIPETFLVRVTPYPRTNEPKIMTMYSNNVKTSYVIHKENSEDLQTMSFPLIEN